jgi:hypothetical protein
MCPRWGAAVWGLFLVLLGVATQRTGQAFFLLETAGSASWATGHLSEGKSSWHFPVTVNLP